MEPVDDPGEVLIDDIVAPTIEELQNTQNDDAPGFKDFDNNASTFTTEAMYNASARNIYDNHMMGPGNEENVETVNQDIENSVNPQNLPA